MMLFNDQGKIDNIVPFVRNDAHRIIEECMLAANVCAPIFLQVTTSLASTVCMRANEEKLRNCAVSLANSGWFEWW